MRIMCTVLDMYFATSVITTNDYGLSVVPANELSVWLFMGSELKQNVCDKN